MGHDCSHLSATRVPTPNFCFSGFERRGRHPCRSFSFRRREWRRHTGLILMPLLVLAHDTDKDAKSDLIAGVSARISVIFPCVVATHEFWRNYPSPGSIATANLLSPRQARRDRPWRWHANRYRNQQVNPASGPCASMQSPGERIPFAAALGCQAIPHRLAHRK